MRLESWEDIEREEAKTLVILRNIIVVSAALVIAGIGFQCEQSLQPQRIEIREMK